MNGPQLKINGEWMALPEDFSLSLEQTNPLFNNQGTFSFPFEVPLEPNRHVFRNLADPFGNITLRAVNGLDAELWFDGILLYNGKTETEQNVEITDSVPVTFVSGNSDFKSRIDGLNARDIPLDRDIKLGYVVEEATVYYTESGGDRPAKDVVTLDLPPHMMMNFTEYNVSDAYPIKPYCNVRVCTQGLNSNGDLDGYQILPSKRPFSGVCFYVMYLLDCLFKHLGVVYDLTALQNVEDLKRLAFFTTKCKVEYKGSWRTFPLSDIRKDDFVGKDFTIEYKANVQHPFNAETKDFKFRGRDVYATNENYPDVSIEDVITDLETAFGIKILYDSSTNRVDFVLLKDVFLNEEVVDLHPEILSLELTRYKASKVRLTYGKNEDTAFNYDDYSNVEQYDGYEHILKDGISRYDTVCKIDTKTGNAFRVKVNKETGLGATLMEVGGYRDYVIEGDGDETTLSIKFSPAISNDVAGGGVTERIYRRTGVGNGTSTRASETRKREQCFAVFADVELTIGEMYDKKNTIYIRRASGGTDVEESAIGYWYLKGKCYELFDDKSNEESPMQSYDAGYVLGIMRGPGNDSGLEFYENYDSEGNDSFTMVASDYAFTSDSCDNYGRFFDYNGKLPGGVNLPGTFSLKLIAGKPDYPIDSNYEDRGLAHQFLSEYLYFLSHRKLVTLSVKMSISEIIHIDFLKRHRIGEFVGFINKVSYSLDGSGVNDVEIEMYIL